MRQAVEVDASDALAAVQQIEWALTKPGLRKLETKAKRYMRASTERAFATASDPDTGRPWAARKQAAGHPPLNMYGELKGWIRHRSRVWQGRYASRLYLKFTVPDTARAKIKAGAVYHGRKQSRSAAGTKLGGRPKTGYMPGRPYTGLSRGARRKLWLAAKMNLRKSK